jgi:hypothetical protein
MSTRLESTDVNAQGSGLDRSVNHWDKINDFKWLDPKAPSPHWSILDVQERFILAQDHVTFVLMATVAGKVSWKKACRVELADATEDRFWESFATVSRELPPS